MKAPATPENETDRLNSLRESGLLEIDSSPAFDRLTRLAKRFFQVPLAMVNLIDEHSLIVKSADGQAPGSVPRNISFCGHTILTEAPLVVGDMLQDDRFADNPLVAGEPRVRFYAGFPLRLRDG
ncbi:GAF domain-containing protein, partial [Enterobacter asburiae]